MIKNALVIILFACVISVFAQYNSISADFVGPTAYVASKGESGRIGLFYERTLNSYWSLNVSYNQLFEKGSATGVESSDFGYYGLLISGKLYPYANKKRSPLGFFLEPNITFGLINKGYYLSEGIKNYSGKHASLGLSLGYKARVTKQIFIDAIFGYGYSYLYNFENNMERKSLAKELGINYDDLDKDFLPFRAFFNLGYVFPEVEGVVWDKEKNKKTWAMVGLAFAVAIVRVATLGQN